MMLKWIENIMLNSILLIFRSSRSLARLSSSFHPFIHSFNRENASGWKFAWKCFLWCIANVDMLKLLNTARPGPAQSNKIHFLSTWKLPLLRCYANKINVINIIFISFVQFILNVGGDVRSAMWLKLNCTLKAFWRGLKTNLRISLALNSRQFETSASSVRRKSFTSLQGANLVHQFVVQKVRFSIPLRLLCNTKLTHSTRAPPSSTVYRRFRSPVSGRKADRILLRRMSR